MPSEEELKNTGLTPADYEQEAEIWPENWPVFDLLLKFGTQWRVGMNGATGLDYGPIFGYMDRLTLEAEEWDLLFDDLRIVEAEALNAMRTK